MLMQVAVLIRSRECKLHSKGEFLFIYFRPIFYTWPVLKLHLAFHQQEVYNTFRAGYAQGKIILKVAEL